MGDGIMKARSRLRDSLIGTTPAVTLFDTPPSNLENLTDGNQTSVTSEGITTKTGSGTWGMMVFDMGASKTRLIDIDVAIKTSAGTYACYVTQSADNITFVGANESIFSGSGTSYKRMPTQNACITHLRYIQIFFTVSTAATCYLIGYNISAFEL